MIYHLLNATFNLTIDQAAAIYFYTMETPFYGALNAALRSENRSLIRPFIKFVKLFLSGLYLLPLPPAPTVVFRGVKEHLVTQYPKDRKFRWWQFSSSTAAVQVLQDPKFCGKEGARTVFNISTRYCVDICRYSAFKCVEEERLILPGMQLQVVGVVDFGHGLHQVQLAEILETAPLLDYLHPALV